MITLSANDLGFAYGTHPVLDGAGFDPLQAGKLTALIGPNAAGKSTLFRLIAGLAKPGSGTIILDGTDLATLSTRERLKRICFMPQFFAANAALTVFDVVMMAHKQLKGWRVSESDMQAVSEVLHHSGIGHLAEAYVSDLSGGQSQMVSVAQALIRKSDVYLFDEPTSALDLHHQLDVLSRIKQAMITRQSIGIMALHDLNLAARFADHLILLGQGSILAQGTPQEVLRSRAISETYGVEIEIATGPREDLIVHAYAS
ncbi:ABC transporter ATP-binding protein [Sulfitobacter pacificus]|uniref:ABC transporter ATP-binding protein n=1 Tax=Sulfitobacter pacificus TaxID=1499314 RepID=UPI00310245FB